MVTFKSLKIRLVHAPKTGGTALCRFLAERNGNLADWQAAMDAGRQGLFHVGGLHSVALRPNPNTHTIVIERDAGDLVESCYRYEIQKGQTGCTPDKYLDSFNSGAIRIYKRAGGHVGYRRHCDEVIDYANLREWVRNRFGEELPEENVTDSDIIRFTDKQKDRARELFAELDK